MKTYKIGTRQTAQDGTILKVELSKAEHFCTLCDGCYFFHPETFDTCTAVGDFRNCSLDRSDAEDVIFVKQPQP